MYMHVKRCTILCHQYDTKIILTHFTSHINAYSKSILRHKSMQFPFYAYHAVRTISRIHAIQLFLIHPSLLDSYMYISMPISSHHSQYIMFLTYVQIHRTYHTNIIYSSSISTHIRSYTSYLIYTHVLTFIYPLYLCTYTCCSNT